MALLNLSLLHLLLDDEGLMVFRPIVALACTTISLAAIAVCVSIVIRMTNRAMSFSGISCCMAVTPQNIHLIRYQLKMVWIDAKTIATQVIHAQPVRYLMPIGLVCKAICFTWLPSNGELPVSSTVFRSGPEPTSALSYRQDIPMESL